MSFNSIQYLIFFPVVALVYFLLSYRYRWLFLLAASYYFYMCWRPEYVLLIVASTLVDYFAGIRMENTNDARERKQCLILSLIVNLGLLFLFKYFNFFNDSFRMLFSRFNIFYGVPEFECLLPVGISFYTFQTLSYTIEVYRKNKKAERHLGIFALYVAFFPQLVAGPIERAQNLLPQFFEKYDFDYKRVVSGLRLILWGMFKKVVIADRLALVVDQIYGVPQIFPGPMLTLATLFFAFQIYCDFSGYSDIAIGSARVLGFNLMENFRRPYLASSIREFWQRWHISLSTWFRDYLYIPLGGSKVSLPRWCFAVVVTFLLSGLWHGANWTFLFWGGLHGLAYLLYIVSKNFRQKVSKVLHLEKIPDVNRLVGIGLTFCFVYFTWIFFRANNLSDAFYVATHLFTGWEEGTLLLDENCVFVLVLIFFLFCLHAVQEIMGVRFSVERMSFWLRWPLYIVAGLMIMNLGVIKEIPFIYFQF